MIGVSLLAFLLVIHTSHSQQGFYDVPGEVNYNSNAVKDSSPDSTSIQEIPINSEMQGFNEEGSSKPKVRPMVYEITGEGSRDSPTKLRPIPNYEHKEEAPHSVYSGTRKPIISKPMAQYDILHVTPQFKFPNGFYCKYVVDCASGCCVEHSKNNRTCAPLALEKESCSNFQIKGGLYEKHCPCATGACVDDVCQGSTSKE